MITITLNKIKEESPCHTGWKKVFKAHKHLGMDTEFPLSSVINSNRLEDTIWCMRCLPEHENLWRKYAVWCARQVAYLMKDDRSINALDVAWKYSDGDANNEDLRTARDAAWDAARAAARDAAREAQKKKLIKILNAGKWED